MNAVHSFFELAGTQSFPIQFVMGIAAVCVAVALTAFVVIVVGLFVGWIDQEITAIRYTLQERRRQRRITDDAMQHQHQKELHHAIRQIVADDQRRRLELVAKIGERR